MGPGCSFHWKMRKVRLRRGVLETVLWEWACLSSCHHGGNLSYQEPHKPSLSHICKPHCPKPWHEQISRNRYFTALAGHCARQLLPFPIPEAGIGNVKFFGEVYFPTLHFHIQRQDTPISWKVSLFLFTFSVLLKVQCTNKASSCRLSPTKVLCTGTKCKKSGLK